MNHNETNEEWEIGELATRAGVTTRTIRYYVTMGLLPPGAEKGVRRVYSHHHLQRLRWIRKLKDQFLPLDEIRRRLGEFPDLDFGRMFYSAAEAKSPMEEVSPDPHPPMHCSAPLPSKRPLSLKESQSSYAVDIWKRETLTPGLEIHVQQNAPPGVNNLVKRIRDLVHASPFDNP